MTSKTSLWDWLRQRAREGEPRSERLNRVLRTLGATNPVLLREQTETQLFANVCQSLVEQGGFSMAWIGHADFQTGRAQIVSQAGFAQGVLESLDIRVDDSPKGQGPTGTAIRTGQTVVNEDTETNTQFALWRERARQQGYRSAAVFPLRVYGEVIGNLNVYAATAHAFGQDEVLLLERFAGDIGAAVERLRSMARVEASERELAAILRNMQDTYYRTDNDGRILRASDSVLQLLGFTRDEMKGRILADFYAEVDGCSKFLTALQAAGGELLGHEAQLRHRDGSTLWVSTNAHYVRDAASGVIGVEGTVRNVTDRKRAEHAIRESEGRYRTIVEIAQEGIWTIDAESRTSFVNQKMAEILGYCAEEMLGKSLFDFVDDEGRTIAAQNVERRKQGIAEQHDFKFLRKDGQAVWAELNTAPLQDAAGQYAGALAMVTDITQRRSAEQALRASESYLRTVIHNAPVVLFALDRNGVIQMSDGKGLVALHLAPGELVGRSIFEVYRDFPEVCTMARQALAGESPVQMIAIGSLVYEVHYAPTMDSEGQVDTVIGLAIDITARKLAEDEIRVLNATLEQRVKERTAELERTNKELESFAYSVSHDLRAPLRAIDGFSRVLLDDHAAVLNREAQHLLSRVCAAAQRLGMLIDDLLDLSRIGRAALHVAPADLSRLAGEVVAQLREAEPGRAVAVEITEGLIVRGDARLLRLVLENLFENAWKYTGKTPQAHVSFGALQRDGETVFYVRDNGTGFDMQYAGKLFGAFQRLHGSEFAGSGIGLATVARIIHRHGGRVWAEAAVGKGATFFFTVGNLAEPGATGAA